MLELVAHPIRGAWVVVAPENFVGVAERRRGVVHAADEGIGPAIRVLDDAGLAVHEYVVGVARDDAHLHAAGCEKVVQAAIAFAREQQVEPVLGRLPRGDERARQRLLAIARRLGDLHVVRIKVAVADDADFADALERLADDFEQRGSEIARDPQIARGTCEPRW